MDTKLTAEDVNVLNARINSPDSKIADSARNRLTQSVNQPDGFADAVAEDWARRIVRRINDPKRECGAETKTASDTRQRNRYHATPGIGHSGK